MKPEEVISEVLKSIVEKAAVGVNLLELEKRAETAIAMRGAESANKGYQPSWSKTPFPSVVCLGVNEQVGHNIPRDFVLQDGDLLKIDCGIVINGQASDAGLTIPIGKISDRDERLLRYTKRALYRGIQAIKVGGKVSDVGKVIERYILQMGLAVVRQMNGHGIGAQMHMEPVIPHFIIPPTEKRVGKKYEYTEVDLGTFYEGQIVCIEPHVTYHSDVIKEDDWGIKTRDGRKSCLFEHMVEISSLGVRILTTHITEEVNINGY